MLRISSANPFAATNCSYIYVLCIRDTGAVFNSLVSKRLRKCHANCRPEVHLRIHAHTHILYMRYYVHVIAYLDAIKLVQYNTKVNVTVVMGHGNFN